MPQSGPQADHEAQAGQDARAETVEVGRRQRCGEMMSRQTKLEDPKERSKKQRQVHLQNPHYQPMQQARPRQMEQQLEVLVEAAADSGKQRPGPPGQTGADSQALQKQGAPPNNDSALQTPFLQLTNLPAPIQLMSALVQR